MENKNRGGNGIFLGVVAVATLIIAIIGATFAYFSITAESDANAVNVTAYEFGVTLSVSPVYPASGVSFNGMIPMDPDAEIGTNSGKYNLLYALNEAANRCVDSNGYQVCAVYSLTFNNTSADSITLAGTLKTTGNSPALDSNQEPKSGRTAFTSLKYRMASGELNNLSFDTELDEHEDSVVLVRNVPSAVDGTVSIGNVVVPASGSLVKYVVVYLDGTGDGTDNAVDQSAQMGASYQGQLSFVSSAGSMLTGTFNLG